MKCKTCDRKRRTGTPFCRKCLCRLPAKVIAAVIKASRCRTQNQFQTIDMAAAQIESILIFDARLEYLMECSQ